MQSIIIHLLFHKLVGPAKKTELSYKQSTPDAVLMYVLSLFLGNCLYYLGENGLSMRRVILTEKEKDEVLTEVHAGHFAVKRMTDKINQRFYWKGITRDVHDGQVINLFKLCLIQISSNISCDTLRHMRFNTRNAGPFLLTTSATRGVK